MEGASSSSNLFSQISLESFSSMAAASAQDVSSSRSRCTYHVFLSFSGEDTRKNFTDHLYTALVQAGFHTFRDDDEIKRGKNIMTEIQKAIQESRLSIIVFSKDYASSRWCLEIMERRKTGKHEVLPVFYDVDPSQVRKQTGTFAEAFARHEELFKGEIGKVKAWREALRNVADLGGMNLQNRHQARFIQDIVKEIGRKLNRTTLFVAPYLVGIDNYVEGINLWLQDGSNDVGIATISGIGGIGKTCIAKIVYNLNFDIFEGSSFLANIRECSEEPDGLIRIQKQLLSDILRVEKYKIHNLHEGLNKIEDAIGCKRVLLVLDDVDDLDQLNAIIGMWEWFYSGSKIVITTRNEHLLRSNVVSKMFKIKELAYKESLKLFSWYAFGQYYPIKGYMEHSRTMVQHCGGLPLALQTLGSSLSGKSINVWESTFEKLKTIPNSKVQKILRISYDSLEDDHDQNLFLDIACFFTGKDKDYTVRILDACGFYTTSGIQNLIDRCLLTINEYNKLCMQGLLRDMGREIIRQESPEDLGRRSRLWRYTDAFDVLREKMGTESIKGLTLDLLKLMEEKHSGKTPSINSEHWVLDVFSRKTVHKTSTFALPISNEVDLETKAFAEMRKLKLLQLNYIKLKGGYEDFPKNMVWVCWRGFPLGSIPNNFYLGKLVVLEMRNSNLKHAWKGTRCFVDLKVFDLSHSHGLIKTPDFSGLPSLERLALKHCTSLVEVDESIGDLKKLVFLNLKGCKNLMRLPMKIGMLKSLEELILSGCSKLDELPEDLRKMESLRVLHVDGIAMNQLESTTTSTKKLDSFSTQSWRSMFWPLRRSPRSVSFSMAFLPSSLVRLNVADCNITDNALMSDLSSLPSLSYLDLSGNPISSLPESISCLTILISLKLDKCRELQSLPKLPISLIEFNAEHCTSLERLTDIPNFTFSVFNFVGCEKLVEVPGMFKLEPMTEFHTEASNALSLYDLESVRNTKVNIRSVITDTKWEKAPIQALSECGIFSIFLPGNEVPSWFYHNTGPLISFDVPPNVGPKVFGLNVCGVYAFRDLFKFEPAGIIIINETKGVRWTYTPSFYGIPGENEDMLWLSHWKFGNLLEGGDHVMVCVDMGYNFYVKECGVFLVYESDNEDIVQSNPSWYLTSEVYRDSGQANAFYLDNHRGRDHLWLRRAEEVSLKYQPDSLASFSRLLAYSSCHH